MVETQVSQREIVLEVLETYSDPAARSLYKGQANGTCQYQSDTEKRCAVGRFMTDEALELHGKSSKNIETLSLRYGLNELLKEEYQGYPVSFWSKLQKMHDEDEFWSEDGVTEDGLKYVKHTLGIEI